MLAPRLGAWMPSSWVFPCAYNLGSLDKREKDTVTGKTFCFFLSAKFLLIDPGIIRYTVKRALRI